MRLEEEIADTFQKNEWTWKTTDGSIVPNATDVLVVLDNAARKLYDEEPGSFMEVGRLIIQKQAKGFDVYILAGHYE